MRGSTTNLALTVREITHEDDPTLDAGEVRREPLFSFPVKVCKAVNEKATKPKLDTAAPSGSEIEVKRLDPATGEYFPFEQIIHGKRSGDTFRTIPEEALTAIAERQKPQKDVMIAEGKIPAGDIPRRRITGTFYLQPEDGAGSAYRLAYEALLAEGAAVVTYYTNSRGTCRLATIYASEELECLCLVTIAYAGCEATPDDAVRAHLAAKVDAKQIKMARQILRNLGDGRTLLAEATDKAGEEQKALLEQAMAGEKISVPATPEVEVAATSDLNALLEASIAATPPKKKAAAKRPAKKRATAKA